MKKVGLIFPHQLFERHEILEICDQLYLIEESLFFTQFNFHKQKIAFHRASMKAYEEKLNQKGILISYINSFDDEADIRVLLKKLSENKEIDCIHFIDPTDEWLKNRILKNTKKIKSKIYENPLFINTTEDLKHFFKEGKKSFFQTTFYKQQRQKRNILLDKEGNPEGGKWTFDTENRKKFPNKKTAPNVHFPETNSYWKEAIQYTNKYFEKNIGEIYNTQYYPTSHQEAQKWFNQFLVYRFHYFGDYEDAIVKEELILHHSLLSPLINNGLLDQKKVLKEAIDFAHKENVPINSLEGFVRQIIGWREFIRGMYQAKGNESRTKNYWNFTRKIPKSFYNGTTGIEPIDATIKKILKTGYCHHIERLMVLGNFMLLCEFAPDEVYQWFMELFIDAYDWVMVPNVYGMSQFADGGFFATKPYIGGSNYIKKMSNYKTGNWSAIWDGLFWNFVDKHQDFFKGNPRTSMMFYNWRKMDQTKKTAHLENAEKFLATLD
ncbi:MAG: cryptochrome/photolyase family protein [Chitinophagales bacterium]